MVADMLPSKTIPEASGRKSRTKAKGKQAASRPSKKKARCAPVEMEEIEDEDSARNIAARKAVNEVGAGHQDKRKMQYFTVPHLFLQESSHSSGIPVESTGIPLE